MRRLLAFLLWWSCGLLGAAQAAPLIDEIRFAGNRVTDERILRQEIFLAEGEALDERLLERSRQAIMNLGLFRTVDAQHLEEEGRRVVLFTVKERYYILPIPVIGTRSGGEQYNYGLTLRLDNLQGRNQRLKFTYEHRESISGDEELLKVWEIDYRYPRVLGSWNELKLDLGRRTQSHLTDTETVGEGGYVLEQRRFSSGLSRWLGHRGSSGWWLGGRMNLEQRAYSGQWGAGEAYEDGHAMDLQLDIGYHRVEEHPYYRHGKSYGYTLNESMTWMGSDYAYTRHQFYWRNYHPLGWVDANLDSQVRIGLASGSHFGEGAYSLGGNNLRGYEESLGPGNVMFQLNLEYQHRISGYRQLRAVVFSDLGNVWPRVQDISANGFHPSVGLGLRWRVQRLVDTTLRVDHGFGLRGDEQRTFFSTSASF